MFNDKAADSWDDTMKEDATPAEEGGESEEVAEPVEDPMGEPNEDEEE